MAQRQEALGGGAEPGLQAASRRGNLNRPFAAPSPPTLARAAEMTRIVLTPALALTLLGAMSFSNEVFAAPSPSPLPKATVSARGRDLIVTNVGASELYVDGDRFGNEQPDVWFAKTSVQSGAEYRLNTDKLRAWASTKFSASGPKDVPFEFYLSGPHRDARYRLKGYLQISFRREAAAHITPMEFQVVNQSW